MKKLLGISLVAVLAATPLMAKAETANPSPIAAAESELASNGTNVVTAQKGAYYAGKQITDTDRQATASAAYVKGAYNAAISAVNKVAEDAEDYTDSEIAKLDASVSQTAGADGLALSVTEVDGKITAVTGSIAAGTYEAAGAAAAAVADLDSSASQTAGTDGLALSVTEVDGKITAISGSIAANIYATAAQGAKADTAVQSVTTGDAQSGNGTIKVDGTAVSVYGLGSAAYTDSTAYDAAGAAAAAETAAKSYADGLASNYDAAGAAAAAETAAKSYADGLASNYDAAGSATAAQTAAVTASKNYTDSLVYTTSLSNTSVSGNIPMIVEWGTSSVGSVGLTNGSLTTTITTTAAAPAQQGSGSN